MILSEPPPEGPAGGAVAVVARLRVLMMTAAAGLSKWEQ